MPKKYALTTPFSSGDMTKQISVTEFRLVSFSFNFEKGYTDAGKAVFSVMLTDQNDEYMEVFTYIDAQALAFALAIDTGNFSVVSLTEQIFTKLQTIPDSEGKTLPAGTIV